MVIQDVHRGPVIHQYPVHVVINHHYSNDQFVVMRVMDEVCITFSESDIVIFPLELLCR